MGYINNCKVTTPVEMVAISEKVATGEVITVNDVSPIAHNLAVRVNTAGVKVTKCGKNLFNSDLCNKTQTVNGITVDNVGGGIFHFHGTASTTFTTSLMVANMAVRIDPNKIYTIHAKLLEGVISDMTGLHPFIGVWDTPNGSFNYSSCTMNSSLVVGDTISTVYPNKVVTVKADAKYISRFWLFVNAIEQGAKLDFKIQVWINETAVNLGYEPYNGQTATANADGTVEGLTSTPNMTLYSDTEGAQIECKYIEKMCFKVAASTLRLKAK